MFSLRALPRWLGISLVASLVAAAISLAPRLATPALAAGGIHFVGSPGTSAPPGTLGPYTMTRFAADPRPLFVPVATIPAPNGNVGLSPAALHLNTPNGWATWSHGFSGDVYFAQGTLLVMTMPANTGAVFFYAEPNVFNVFTVTATAQDGTTSGPVSVNGLAGATYFGFFGTGGALIQSVTVTCPAACLGFAVGEFGDAVGCEESGPVWVPRFPGSTSTVDLVDPFRTNANRFLAALDVAGASVRIEATYRPPQRAYLMHWAWEIARAGQDPRTVPAFPGPTPAQRSIPAYRGPDTVNICWVHTDQNGNPDIPASVAAAEQMVSGFQIVSEPALNSEHSLGTAIDMSISWRGSLKIQNASGNLVHIRSRPRTGMNQDLWAVGRTYGVIKLATDPPHWSIDGH